MSKFYYSVRFYGTSGWRNSGNRVYLRECIQLFSTAGFFYNKNLKDELTHSECYINVIEAN